MAVREVLLFPHPALKAVAAPVAAGPVLERVASDLIDTMRSVGHTTGLAATQIGELSRVIVVDVTGHKRATTESGLLVLGNPQLVQERGAEVSREGCLSLPDLTANVRRATSIVIEAVTPSGELVTLATDGFEARCVLHELDHLDGILFLDRVDSLATDVFRRKSYS